MNFNLLAPHYDWLEAVTAGTRLQRARTQWLKALAGCRHILSVGEGYGRFAAACLNRFPAATLTCIEASPAMMAIGSWRTKPWGDRVQWECTEALVWEPPKKYDAIVTCFFLDCFLPETLRLTVWHLANTASECAPWLITDFALPEVGPARWRAKAVHALMYAFFCIATKLPACRLTRADSLLAEQGFHLRQRREFDWGLISAEVWQRNQRVIA